MAAGERRRQSPANSHSASPGTHGMQGSAGLPQSGVSQPGVQAEHTPGPDAPKIHILKSTSIEAAEPTFHRELGLLAGRPSPGPAGARSSHGITPGWKQRERRHLSTAPTVQRQPGLHWGPRSAPPGLNTAWLLLQATHMAGRLGNGQAHAW